MTKRSAGILLYRGRGDALRLLLVHPGGPFWAKKDEGAWSIPKGEYDEGEDPLAVARREFEEELGSPTPAGGIIELGELVQPSRKLITAFAIAGDFDHKPAQVQPVRIGMAAEERAHAILPRGRPRGVVHARRGQGEDPARSATLHRPPA